MAKIEQYFNSQEELNQYYPNGVPSTVLAIVKNGTNGVLMYTYDNNAPEITGGSAEIGGEPSDYSYAVTLSSYTLVGDPNAPSIPANWMWVENPNTNWVYNPEGTYPDDVAIPFTINLDQTLLSNYNDESPLYLGTLQINNENINLDFYGYGDEWGCLIGYPVEDNMSWTGVYSEDCDNNIDVVSAFTLYIGTVYDTMQCKVKFYTSDYDGIAPNLTLIYDNTKA